MKPRNPKDQKSPRIDKDETPRILRKTKMKDQASLTDNEIASNAMANVTRHYRVKKILSNPVTPGKWSSFEN